MDLDHGQASMTVLQQSSVVRHSAMVGDNERRCDSAVSY